MIFTTIYNKKCPIKGIFEGTTLCSIKGYNNSKFLYQYLKSKLHNDLSIGVRNKLNLYPTPRAAENPDLISHPNNHSLHHFNIFSLKN